MKERKAKPGKRVLGTPKTRTQTSRVHQIEIRSELPKILIVCEGTKTEPNYFMSFGVTNDVYGLANETIRVIEKAERINAEEGPFEEIWCVFDRDDFPGENYDNAIHKVESLASKGFRVAYSNESFELWFLLHFEYLDTAVNRTHYMERLNYQVKKINDPEWQRYDKSDLRMYYLLQKHGNEDLADQRAERLLHQYGNATTYSKRCPQTTVHLLVRMLRTLQRNRGY